MAFEKSCSESDLKNEKLIGALFGKRPHAIRADKKKVKLGHWGPDRIYATGTGHRSTRRELRS
jgi:hypothetical protein